MKKITKKQIRAFKKEKELVDKNTKEIFFIIRVNRYNKRITLLEKKEGEYWELSFKQLKKHFEINNQGEQK